MKHIFLIAFLIFVPILIACESTCEESRHLELNCGSYCFKIVKPVLEHMAKLQEQVIGHENKENADTEAKLENIDSQQILVKAKVEEAQSKYGHIESQLAILQEKVAMHDQELQGPRHKFNNNQRMFEKIGSKYYYIEDQHKMNWFAAGYRCQELGGHLFSIQNHQEFEMLLGKLNRDHDYWTDINDLSEEGHFKSHTTGRTAPYLNWGSSSQPDNRANVEHCVHLWNVQKSLQMNDADCTFHLHFVCESYYQ